MDRIIPGKKYLLCHVKLTTRTRDISGQRIELSMWELKPLDAEQKTRPRYHACGI